MMRPFLVLLAALFVTAVAAAGAPDDLEDTAITSLNPENWSEVVTDKSTSPLALLVHEGGGDSKVRESFEKEAVALKGGFTRFAQLDASKYPTLMDRLTVKSFPSVLWYPRGSSVFTRSLGPGPRASASVARFVTAKMGNPVGRIHESYRSISPDQDIGLEFKGQQPL